MLNRKLKLQPILFYINIFTNQFHSNSSGTAATSAMDIFRGNLRELLKLSPFHDRGGDIGVVLNQKT
jgi:hypothetical protein